MKTRSNIWTIAAILVVLLISINLFLNKGTKTDNFRYQIDSLNRANDSLLSIISVNSLEIQRIDSLNAVLEAEIKDAKFRLGELSSQASIYKNMYNEEHNRINKLSNGDLTREFTNAFD